MTHIAFTDAERAELTLELNAFLASYDDMTDVPDCVDRDAVKAMVEGLFTSIKHGEVGRYQAKMLLSLVMENDIEDARLASSLEDKLRFNATI